MEAIFVFIEKLLGVLTSQRFAVTAAGLVVAIILMVNVILPLFVADFGGVDVPEANALAAQIAAAVGQAAVAITFFIGLFRAIAQLVASFQQEPPSLNAAAWDARKLR